MSGSNYYSDYGSGSSSNSSSSSWPNQEPWSTQTNLQLSRSNGQTSASFQNLVMGKCTLEDIMKEFQMNGSDSPFVPDDDRKLASGLSGLGPASAYLRQKSWPEPERTPALRLPHPAPPVPSADWSNALEFTPRDFTSTSTPKDDVSVSSTLPLATGALTGEQLQALHTLPNAVLFAILQDLEQSRDGYKRVKRLSSECRFCKNNGERESYYRSHALKDGWGRVACPVLRAFVCARCGASGDAAHTIKYCPLSTAHERLKSAAMLRSVRLASGRRRAGAAPSPAPSPAPFPAPSPPAEYLVFGESSPAAIADTDAYNSYVTSPLDPLWAALEQKLLL